MKTIIYTQRSELIKNYKEKRDCADQRIADFIFTCGFLPIAAPNNISILKEYINELKICGILLTGGDSLVKYGGKSPERDEVDFFLLQTALMKNIPLYGFCRGMQVIVDFFGGQLNEINGHVAVEHFVTNHNRKRMVNSYHSLGIDKLKGPLKQCDIDINQNIESIFHIEKKIKGIMWHPERFEPFQKEDIQDLQKIFS